MLQISRKHAAKGLNNLFHELLITYVDVARRTEIMLHVLVVVAR